MSSYADLLKRRISQKVARDMFFYEECKKRSKEYKTVLELGDEDLNILNHEEFKVENHQNTDTFPEEEVVEFSPVRTTIVNRVNSFLEIDIENERFSLSIVESSEPPHYCGNWIHFVQSVCLSDEELNNAIYGYGFCFNLVPEEWHKKIIDYLKNKNVVILED